VREKSEQERFEEAVLPHLDAAYNLARWMTHDEHDAEDVVQEAYYRALKFFAGFRGGDGRAWILAVVRHTGYTWLKRNRARDLTTSFDEEIHSVGGEDLDPEHLFHRRVDQQLLHEALAALSLPFREVLVLREMEGLSYQEIAVVTSIPLGTVMSRLARARRLLQQQLTACAGEEG
jgi:RNA polymerase sigma-70 factor (ECF subfamily)